MHPKDADGMTNSVDPDQTAPRSTLFAQAHLSESLMCWFRIFGNNSFLIWREARNFLNNIWHLIWRNMGSNKNG